MLRTTLIDNMAKPTEVLVTINDECEVDEEHFQDTETMFVYDRMRETLIYLTNVDVNGMDQTIQARLDAVKNPSYFTFDRLNKLCWALGSISGCMPSDDENKFVVMVIKELLNLCENTQGKNNKA